MRVAFLAAVASLATGAVYASAVEQSLRPVERPEAVVSAAAEAPQDFDGWLTQFRGRAIEAGISGAVLDAALRGVRYDAEVVRRDRNQNEFTKTIWDYLGTAVSDARVANGRAALKAQADTLAAIEKRYGVDRQVIVAIWGLESAYGGFRGVIRWCSRWPRWPMTRAAATSLKAS